MSLPRNLSPVCLSEGWRFQRFESTEVEPPLLQIESVSESDWRLLDLPHDWGIEGPFSKDLPNKTGKLPWHGIGWYRRSLVLPQIARGERVLLLFEGAMSNAKVYMNGRLLGEWAYGYNSFIVDASHALLRGQTNLLAVRLDNRPNSSRWYPGGGLYRDVWLLYKPVVALEEWSTFIKTKRLSADMARLEVEATVRNNGPEPVLVQLRHQVTDPKGREVTLALSSPVEVLPEVDLQVSCLGDQRHPQIWDLESPNLYSCRTEIILDGQVVHSQETRFGIRTIAWNSYDGFHLNGRRVPLQGVCLHHDLGALGSAFNLRAAERQLEILREMGCNAIRTAHNPPAPAFLDLCDAMGFLVVNELFDNWAISKTPEDYARHFEEWHERDVRNWVLRDRNHPSCIAWSLGNEIQEQKDEPGNHDRARRLVEICRRYDMTRPTTAGLNEGVSLLNGFAAIFDVAGYNYKAVLDKPLNYLNHFETYPGVPLYGAETASCLSSRDVYFFPVKKEKNGGFAQHQVSSYDLYAPLWAYLPDFEFDSLDRFPAIAGEFVWTGFDYLGEPTPYNDDNTNALNFSDPILRDRALEEMKILGQSAPSRSSYFGIIDLAGFPKDRFYLYQGRWRPNLPVAHLLPHWNWYGREGEITPVHAYTNGDVAELFLNGKSLGRKSMGEGEYRLVWEDVRFTPGKLELITYRKGKEWARTVRETTGAPYQLRATVDRPIIKADGRDLAFVTIEVLDAEGRRVPDACPELSFTAEGAGTFIAADNGDATDLTPFSEPKRKAFNGLALTVLRGRKGSSGSLALQVDCPGLASAKVELQVETLDG
jgi:beta-galactosidase